MRRILRIRRLCTLAMALTLAAFLPGMALASPGHLPIHVRQGLVGGASDGKVEAFLGIPYAAPPVGAYRWRPPRPAKTWRGTRDARQFGASCWQPVDPKGFGPWTHEYVVQDAVSEDCLFLNIWRPVRPAERLPVLVWIHGGGFMAGSGSVPIYNGRNLAARGVIVVTLNYRLGALGFLAHPEITRETPAGGAPGNFGLQDQIAALRWLRTNVAAFGGDPGRITLAGQSAGAMSVHALVTSPLAKGLFSAAIAQSGPPTRSMPTPDLAAAERDGLAFGQEKGASTLKDLRGLRPEQLNVGTMGGLRFVPISDGVLLPRSVPDMSAAGQFNDVPMIVGQTADDGVSLGLAPGPLSAAAYQKTLSGYFGEMAPEFAAVYPAADELQRASATRQIRIDRGLATILDWAQDRARSGRSPIYAYLFSHVEPGAGSSLWGSFHSSEIPYVFDTLEAAPERTFTRQDHQVMLAISTYWLNFVRTGNPNGAGQPIWPALDPANPEMIDFGAKTVALPLIQPARLHLYRRFLAQGGTVSLF